MGGANAAIAFRLVQSRPASECTSSKRGVHLYWILFFASSASAGVGFLLGVQAERSQVVTPSAARQLSESNRGACHQAKTILSRLLQLQPSKFPAVDAWLTAHPLIPNGTPYYESQPQWQHSESDPWPKNHPVVLGHNALGEAFIKFHNSLWVGGVLPISAWGHRRGSWDADKSEPLIRPRSVPGLLFLPLGFRISERAHGRSHCVPRPHRYYQSIRVQPVFCEGGQPCAAAGEVLKLGGEACGAHSQLPPRAHLESGLPRV